MNSYKDLITGINPTISNETLADAVVAKTQIIKQKKFRNACVLMIAIVALAGFTITAGAVNGWDYSTIARYFFGGNQIVVDGMHDEVNYTIVENAIEGFTFEITGLYADDMNIMLSIELTSEKPVFGDNYSFMLWPDKDKTLFDHSLDKWISCNLSQSSSYNHDLYKRTILCKLYYIEEPILEGNEYSIAFSRAQFFGPDHLESHSLPGRVEIKFAIDKLALINSITVNPNILLDNGYTIDEISINPFNISISATGPKKEFHHDVEDYLSLVDMDGNEIKLNPLKNIFDKDGQRLKFKENDGVIITVHLLDFDSVYNGPIYDETGNEIIFIYYGVRTGIKESQRLLKVDLYEYNPIDVNNLSAIIIFGEKIPIR